MLLPEERQELLRIARELHAELQAHNKRVNHCINKLLSEADALKMQVLDGQTEAPTAKAVVYVGSLADPVPASTLTKDPPPGKRACSLCRQPGHRAKNCPNAHIVQQQKKDAVAARPVKRKRGPVTPERRAQLAENLKKARAAKKGKS